MMGYKIIQKELHMRKFGLICKNAQDLRGIEL